MRRDGDAIREAARELAARLDELGRVSDERGRLTRTFLSPAMGRANRKVGEWMRGAGLSVREDAWGNLVGRRDPGPRAARGSPRRPRSAAPVLVLGSHLDTVRDAGRFDGALGVLLPLAALRVLDAEGVALPFAVEVVGFSEEEGVRFGSGYIGSKGYAGRLRPADLRLRDDTGRTVAEVLAAHRSGPPARAPERAVGYLETHIEQGPALEAAGRAVGVVSAIAGQTRGRVIFLGRAGHAGTVPMALRRDAVAGAAEWIGWLERFARSRPPLVATVGTLVVKPGAANVIAAEAALSLDIRHPRDAVRRAALAAALARARSIARRRSLRFRWELTQDNPAVTCDRRLRRALEDAARELEGPGVPVLASGAGHDAVVLAEIMPVAMLFVRCRGGISHHRDEWVAPRDLLAALRVLCGVLRRLGASP